MIQEVVLEFPGDPERVNVGDIAEYKGDKDLATLSGLEGKVDTREMSLTFLGDMFPDLRKLRLNNSIIPSVRDIGCSLVNLRFLSLARCNITSLDGIGTISQNLEELYLAFNKITDVMDLLGMEKLKIVDLEDNLITDLGEIEILTASPRLQALTLAGNPAADCEDYRERVRKLLPKLVYLDEKRLRPPKPKTPRPPAESPRQSTVQFPAGVVNQAPRSLVKMSKEGSSSSSPSPPPSTPSPPTPSSPQQEFKPVEPPMPPPTIAKLDFSHLDEDNEVLMTEQLLDKVDERPTSSIGTFKDKVFPEFGMKRREKPKQTLTNKPHIFRPMSAKGRGPPR